MMKISNYTLSTGNRLFKSAWNHVGPMYKYAGRGDIRYQDSIAVGWIRRVGSPAVASYRGQKPITFPAKVKTRKKFFVISSLSSGSEGATFQENICADKILDTSVQKKD